MPTWTLTMPNGTTVNQVVEDYRTDKRNVVLAAIVSGVDNDNNKWKFLLTLSPTHKHKEVPQLVHDALGGAVGKGGGAVGGYKLGSAVGVIGGLAGAVAGVLLTSVAQSVIDDLFGEEDVIDSGNYYDDTGVLALKGIIKVKPDGGITQG